MISQQGITGLVQDYTRALSHINRAALILEDASILAVEVTGHFGQHASATLITNLNETHQQIYRALEQIRQATPTV